MGVTDELTREIGLAILDATANWRAQMSDAGIADSEIALLKPCFERRDTVERWCHKTTGAC